MEEKSRKGRKRGTKKRSLLGFFVKFFLSIAAILTVLSVVGFVFFIQPELSRLRGIAYEKLAGSNLKDLTKRSDTVVLDYEGKTLGTINAGH